MQFDSRTVGRHSCGRAVSSEPGAQFIITGDNFADGPPIPIPLGAADPSLAGTRGEKSEATRINPRVETGVGFAIRNKRDTGAVEGGRERESREQDGRGREGRMYRGEKRAGLGLRGRAERFIWLKAHPPSRIDR